MRAVNLLPAGYQKANAEARLPRLPLPGRLGDPLWLGPIVGTVLVVIVLAVGYTTQSGAVDDREQTLEALQVELAARLKPAKADTTRASDAATRLAVATTAASARVGWEEVLHQFSLVLPEDISVTTLTAAAPGAAAATADAAATPSGFIITGYTVSQPSVARLLTRLAQAPTLGNVQLQSTTRVELEGRPVIQFTVAADVIAEGASS